MADSDVGIRAHTPGPWRVDPEMGSKSYIRAASGEVIASTTWKYGQVDVPAQANARLIAAAPDLLEAAKQVLDRGYVSESIEEERGDHLLLAAAIAKAEGR